MFHATQSFMQPYHRFALKQFAGKRDRHNHCKICTDTFAVIGIIVNCRVNCNLGHVHVM